MKRLAITLLTLLLLTGLASATLLRITDTGSPPGLQFNMLQYPVSPLNRDLENFGIGLPHPYPDEMAIPCAFYPPCPQGITQEYPNCMSGGASHVNVYIDGNHFVNNTGLDANRLRYYTVPGYPQLLSGSGGPDTIWTKWYINSPGYPYQIEMWQKNWIDFVDRGGEPYPAVYFQFRMFNGDEVSHAVGVMLHLAIKLGNRSWCTDCAGGSDNPDFQMGGVPYLLRRTRAFGLTATPPSSIPAFYLAYERGPTWPDTDQVVLFADLAAPGLTVPDFFGVGNRTSTETDDWDDVWRMTDSAMIVDAGTLTAWGPLTLEPGEEVTWVTRVGLGPATPPVRAGTIQVNEISLPDMWFDRCRALPETLIFNYQLLNTHLTHTAHGVGARLEFLARVGCFSFVTPQTVMLAPDSLVAYTFAPATWRVIYDVTDCAMPPGDSARVPVRVISQSSSAGFASDTAYDTITVRWHFGAALPRLTPLWTAPTPRTTCDPACVSWVLEHSDSIVADSIYLYVDGVRQTFGPAQWINAPGRYDTLRICVPRPASDTALVELRRFYDVYGCTEDSAMVRPVRLQWDRKPPVVTSCTPPPGFSTPTRTTPIQITLVDSVFGDSVSLATLDSNCISFTLNSMGRTLRSIPLSDPQLSWNASTGTLTYTPSLGWAYADTVTYCLLDACDIGAPLACGGSHLVRDTCVTFFVTPAFPDVELITPDTSSVIVSCDDSTICVKWLVTNFYGINGSSVRVYVNGANFGIGENGLTFVEVPGSPYDTLRLCPATAPIWREGINTVLITHICDVLAACLDSVGRGSFTIVRDSFGTVHNGWNLIAQSRGPRWGPGAMPPGIATAFHVYSLSSYVLTDSLDLGQGAWVLASADGVNLPYIGCSEDSVTFDLVRGWNLVGGISYPVSLGAMVVDPPGALMVTYALDDSRATYRLETSQIVPGKGYWMLASGAARVTLRR